jgi:hypothetical protein
MKDGGKKELGMSKRLLTGMGSVVVPPGKPAILLLQGHTISFEF